MGLASVFLEISRKPTIGDVISEFMVFVAPLWIAVIAGVLVGWAWRPKWANFGGEVSESSSSKDSSKASRPSAFRGISSIPSLDALKFQLPSCISWSSNDGLSDNSSSASPSKSTDCANLSSHVDEEKTNFANEEDLQHLFKLVEVRDGGPAWIQMMDRSTPTMSYQAWRRDPETGPPQYRSRTVFEDATPEMVRDFFWDDEFRMKWDDMLIHVETLEANRSTGTMAVRWVRKFPFFCSDREYVIGRRIWDVERSFYCITKGVPYPSVPRHKKPRRVDLYYSSWCIRAVESRRGDGQMTACEVLLFHHEDMGIPWEIAKLGVRQGMWGAVKKIDPGLRAYQKLRASGAPLSRCALMAQVNSKVTLDYLVSLETCGGNSLQIETVDSAKKHPIGRNIPKLLVVGGAIALACSLDKGLLTKAVIFGVGRRFAKIGRKL